MITEKAAENNLCAVLCAGHFNSVKIYYNAQVRPKIHFEIIIIVTENNLKIHPSGVCGCVFVSHISLPLLLNTVGVRGTE